MAQAAAARPVHVEVTFEIYVRKNGRWLIEDVLEDRDAALEVARQLAARKGHEAVRVIREHLDPASARSSERIIFDSSFPATVPVAPASRPAAASAPAAAPEPVLRRAPGEPESNGAPWLVAISAVLGLTFAALGFWFIGAIG